MLGIEPLLFGIEFLDLEWWLGHFGEALFWISLAVLFVECGLLFPFLPGDTLLFSIGLFIATEQIDLFPGGVATGGQGSLEEADPSELVVIKLVE